jgi:hypothetical protein
MAFGYPNTGAPNMSGRTSPDTPQSYDTAHAIGDALRLIFMGIVSFFPIYVFVVIVLVSGWKGTLAEHTMTILYVAAAFQVLVIFRCQAYVFKQRAQRKMIYKKQVQAVEYVYLLYGTLGVFGIMNVSTVFDRTNAQHAERDAHWNLERATPAIDEGLKGCSDNANLVTENSTLSEACAWVRLVPGWKHDQASLGKD